MKLVNDCKKKKIISNGIVYSRLNVMIIIEYFKDNKCNLFDLEIRKNASKYKCKKNFFFKTSANNIFFWLLI